MGLIRQYPTGEIFYIEAVLLQDSAGDVAADSNSAIGIDCFVFWEFI